MSSEKKVLVTGATGFIGRHLIKELMEKYEVVGVCRKIPGINSDNIEFVVHDFMNPLSDTDFPKDIDIILHLAAVIANDIDGSRKGIYQVNTLSTLELLEYGKEIGIESFIYASTGGVYGYNKKRLKEDQHPSPIDFYALTKYESDLLINSYSDYFSTIILRYFFPYGPGQKNRLIPSLIQKIIAHKPITIYNEGNPRINPIYISDAVELTKRVLSLKGNHTINIAGMTETNIIDLSKLIYELIGKKPEFNYVNDSTVSDLVGDISKMLSILRYTPKVSLENGIKKCIKSKS